MIVLATTNTLAAGASVATQLTTTVMGMELNAGVEVYKLLYGPTQLGNTVATIYTVPASTTAFVKSIHVVNNDTSARTATFAVNGTVAANYILPPVTIPAGGFALFIAERGWTVYDSTGQVQYGTAGSLLRVTNILQGTTSFVPGAGTRALYVEMVGGGAGGGGVANAATNSGAAGGGGAGAFSALFTTVIKTYTVQVGAGGNGGTAGANNGSVGTDSTFDSASACTAKGGAGGIADTIATIHVGGLGGAGGLASGGVGDIKADGGGGGVGLALAAAQAVSGAGGDSFFGGGAPAHKTQAAGANAIIYGTGGAGGCALSGGASAAGGNGANGLIRVHEFAG